MIVGDDKKCIPVTGKSMVSIITSLEGIFEKISLMVKFFWRTSSYADLKKLHFFGGPMSFNCEVSNFKSIYLGDERTKSLQKKTSMRPQARERAVPTALCIKTGVARKPFTKLHG